MQKAANQTLSKEGASTMENKINELKNLIESLEEDSPLRQQLEKTLDDELQRLADAEAKAAANEKLQEEAAETEEDDGDTSTGSETGSDILDDIGEKIEELLEDEKFIVASTGFLLGAATVYFGKRLFRH